MDPAVLEPIPGPNPSGADALSEYEPREALTRLRRVRKQQWPDPDAGPPVDPDGDWRYVAGACGEILIHHSKNLRIVAWLAEAQFAIDGFPGLQDGLEIMSGLISTFWETLHPKMDDGDKWPRRWVIEVADKHLSDAVTAWSHRALGPLGNLLEEVRKCQGSLDELDELCHKRLAPAEFWHLHKALREVPLKLADDRWHARRVGLGTGVSRDSENRGPVAPESGQPDVSAATPAGSCPRRVGLGDGVSHDSEQTGLSTPKKAAPQQAALQFVRPDTSPGAQAGGRRPRVDFTLTAPAVVVPQIPFELFVWAHEPEQRSRVLARAREEMRVRDLLARTKGPFQIPHATCITVGLRIEGAVIDEPEDSMIWEGESTSVSFVVTIPQLRANTRCSGSAHIYADGIQIARISFLLSAEGAAESILETRAIRYRTAFASYASADRDTVLGRIQGILKIAPDLEVYLDVLSLRSGSNWEEELWRVIPASDIFYLFWSARARKSEWVEREWRFALRERGIGFIDPIPLQPPEESPPPPELASLHFNDWTLAFRRIKPKLSIERDDQQ
jgi:hypothetical protein